MATDDRDARLAALDAQLAKGELTRPQYEVARDRILTPPQGIRKALLVLGQRRVGFVGAAVLTVLGVAIAMAFPSMETIGVGTVLIVAGLFWVKGVL